jgi:hypothetical protein
MHTAPAQGHNAYAASCPPRPRYRVNSLRIYRDLVLEPDVPEPVVPLPVLLPEPVVPEPLLPEPIVPVPEPVPEPVGPGSVSPDFGLG